MRKQPEATVGTYAVRHMQTGPDAVLAELDLGHVTVRAVRTRVSDELREMLAAGDTAVGDEIIEVRWGDAPSGQPVLSERPTMIIIDDSLALVFGLLPDRAVSAEAVAPDGQRVACTIAPGVWLVVLPNNQRGRSCIRSCFRTAPGLRSILASQPIGSVSQSGIARSSARRAAQTHGTW